MIKRNAKLIAALAVVASLTTGFTTVNAASVHSNTVKGVHQFNKNNTKVNKLDALVTAGTITSAQETSVLDALKAKKTNTKEVLDALVTAGTITSDQETAMINSLTSLTNKTSQN